MKSKKFIVGLFTILISMPLIFTSVNNLTGIKLDTTLQGNFDAVQKPDGGVILPNQWFTGQYQSEFNNYFNNTFVPRATMLKTYNQLRYSLFDQGREIISENGSITEKRYLYDALVLSDEYNYSLPKNQIKVEDYVQHLESIHNKLETLDKQLIVLSTPTKAIFNPDSIPKRYLKEKIDAKRAIDVFNECIADTDIVYFNSTTYLQQYVDEEWPVFYKTGVHWSRPAEQLVSKEVYDLMNAENDCALKTFYLYDLQKQNDAFGVDKDVYNLLNIWDGVVDKTYYEFKSEAVLPEDYDELTILYQGGSFGHGLRRDYAEKYIGTTYYEIFYKSWWRDLDDIRTPINSWEEVPLQKFLDECNTIVIEINESYFAGYSEEFTGFNDGFVLYLDQFLDAYAPQKVEKNWLQNFDCSKLVCYPKDTIRGLGGIEGDFAWIYDSAIVQLKNTAIDTNGLTIEFTIPQHLCDVSNEEDNIKIYVNGCLEETILLKDAGRKIISFSPNQLVSENSIYTIELHSSNSFVPAELGINDDTRSLALQIHYIGEAR